MTRWNLAAKRPVKALHFTSGADAYREGSATMLECTPLATAKNRGAFEVNTWYGDQCIFIENHTDAFAMSHGKQHIGDTSHFLILRRMVSGNVWGRTGDDIITYTPGPIYLQDQELAYEGIQEPAVFQNAIIVKSAIGFDPSIHIRSGQINATSVAGRCLTAAWERVFADLWAKDTHIDADLYDQFLACIKVALGAPPEREDVRMHARNALFDIICRFIENNLGDFELSVAHILREFGVSRATLFRMFEQQGGVRHYIRQRRATRALLDVAQQPYHRGAIRSAAEHWGFSSAPNFNRIIRELYGNSPRAMFEKPTCQIPRPVPTNFAAFIQGSCPMRGASF
ncbi:MAG: AraC family transcriptional regulator [Pseudomonadota bacterium]